MSDSEKIETLGLLSKAKSISGHLLVLRFVNHQRVVDEFGHHIRDIPRELAERTSKQPDCLFARAFFAPAPGDAWLLIVVQQADPTRWLGYSQRQVFRFPGRYHLTCPEISLASEAALGAAIRHGARAYPSPAKLGTLS